MALKKSQKSLKKWTKQEWGTKSGKPSTQGKKATGERYLPKKARAALSDAEYAATSERNEPTQRKESSTPVSQRRLPRKQRGIVNELDGCREEQAKEGRSPRAEQA